MVCFSYGSAESKASVDARLRIEYSSIQVGLISYTTTVSSFPKETDLPTANSSIAVCSWHRWTHTSTHHTALPPSASILMPVMNADSSAAKNKQAAATSLASQRRPRGTFERNLSRFSGVNGKPVKDSNLHNVSGIIQPSTGRQVLLTVQYHRATDKPNSRGSCEGRIQPQDLSSPFNANQLLSGS